MNNREIYEVGRADYAAFVEGIKPSARDIRIEEEGATVFTNIYSASRNMLLCGRASNPDIPEKYYIYASPTAEESQPQIPKTRLVLETREQVQAFFDIISKLQKEHK